MRVFPVTPARIVLRIAAFILALLLAWWDGKHGGKPGALFVVAVVLLGVAFWPPAPRTLDR